MPCSKSLYHKFVRKVVKRAKQANNKAESESYPCSSLVPAQINNKRKHHIKQKDHTERPANTDDIRLIIGKQTEYQRRFGNALDYVGKASIHNNVNQNQRDEEGKKLFVPLSIKCVQVNAACFESIIVSAEHTKTGDQQK